VFFDTRSDAMICVSVCAGPPSASSAASRMRAFASFTAAPLPTRIIRSNSARSAGVNVTW
jgi:hypothetical protein